MNTLSFLINIIESTILVSILCCLHMSFPTSDCKDAKLNLTCLSRFNIKLTDPLQRLQRPSKRIIYLSLSINFQVSGNPIRDKKLENRIDKSSLNKGLILHIQLLFLHSSKYAIFEEK